MGDGCCHPETGDCIIPPREMGERPKKLNGRREVIVFVYRNYFLSECDALMTYFYPPDMQRRNERDRDKSICIYGEGEFPEVKKREL